MHEMQTIVIDVPGACHFCLSDAWLHCAKTAEWIRVPFGVKTQGYPVDEGPDSPR